MPGARLAVITAAVALLAGCGAAPPVWPHPAATSDTDATPFSPGTVTLGADTVRILGYGEATFAELRRLIDSARSSVDVEVYEFGRLDLAAAIVAAHARG